VRLLALTGAIFLTAGIAGRLASQVPARLLIGPGFGLVGLGLLLMRGLDGASAWTHLLPGLIVAGVGAGFVSVPLASTAVGVVPPSRAGMASGINSTFRQVGIASGVAALGSVFASRIRDGVVSHLAGTPLAHSAHTLATGISTGHASQLISSTPPAVRGQLAAASVNSTASALNDILLIAAVIAFCGSVIGLVLIRQRDFADNEPQMSHSPAQGRLALDTTT